MPIDKTEQFFQIDFFGQFGCKLLKNYDDVKRDIMTCGY